MIAPKFTQTKRILARRAGEGGAVMSLESDINGKPVEVTP